MPKCLLEAARLVIDPGHGGTDPGAVSGGVREKDIVLVFSIALAAELRSRGHTLKLTRESDTFVELADRGRVANEFGAQAFVSVHANAAAAGAAFGAWVIHHATSARGEKLAQRIARRHPAKVYPDASGWTGGRRLAVLRNTAAPAALIELGFLTNDADRRMLTAPETAKSAAREIADGIEDWLRVRP